MASFLCLLLLTLPLTVLLAIHNENKRKGELSQYVHAQEDLHLTKATDGSNKTKVTKFLERINSEKRISNTKYRPEENRNTRDGGQRSKRASNKISPIGNLILSGVTEHILDNILGALNDNSSPENETASSDNETKILQNEEDETTTRNEAVRNLNTFSPDLPPTTSKTTDSNDAVEMQTESPASEESTLLVPRQKSIHEQFIDIARNPNISQYLFIVFNEDFTEILNRPKGYMQGLSVITQLLSKCAEMASCEFNRAMEAPECYCDDLCTVYNDCCLNMNKTYQTSHDRIIETHKHFFPMMTCFENENRDYKDTNGMYVVSQCPSFEVASSYMGSDDYTFFKSRCTTHIDEAFVIPVMSTNDVTLHFRNAYCALCHNVSDYVFWWMKAGDSTSGGYRYGSVGEFVSVSPPDGAVVRYCRNATFSKCPVKEHMSATYRNIDYLCNWYSYTMAPVDDYFKVLGIQNDDTMARNIFCLLCNTGYAFLAQRCQRERYTATLLRWMFHVEPNVEVRQSDPCERAGYLSEISNQCQPPVCPLYQVPVNSECQNLQLEVLPLNGDYLLWRFYGTGDIMTEELKYLVLAFIMRKEAILKPFKKYKIISHAVEERMGNMADDKGENLLYSIVEIRIVLFSTETLLIDVETVRNLQSLDFKWEMVSPNRTISYRLCMVYLLRGIATAGSYCNIRKSEDKIVTNYRDVDTDDFLPGDNASSALAQQLFQDRADAVHTCLTRYDFSRPFILDDCNVQHLVQFSKSLLLLDKYPNAPFAEIVLTYTSMILSTFALLYTIYRGTKQRCEMTVIKCILLNMMGVKVLGNIGFLIGCGANDIKELCVAIAIFLHYTWLSSFFWGVVCALHFYFVFVLALSSSRPSLLAKSRISPSHLFFGYGLPIVIVLPSVVLDVFYGMNDFYGYGDPICFITKSEGLLVGYTVPVCISIFATFLLFAVTFLHVMVNNSSSRVGKPMMQKFRVYFPVFFRLSALLSLTWIAGFVANWIGNDYVWYTFMVLNGLHGVFMVLTFNKSVPANEKESTTLSRSLSSSSSKGSPAM